MKYVKNPYFGEPGHTLTFQFCTLFREENTDWKLICWDNHPPTQLWVQLFSEYYSVHTQGKWGLYDCSTKNTHFRCLCTGVAIPTFAGGDASVHIPHYLRRTGSKILVYSDRSTRRWLLLLHNPDRSQSRSSICSRSASAVMRWCAGSVYREYRSNPGSTC